jgi:hypothetical protein
MYVQQLFLSVFFFSSLSPVGPWQSRTDSVKADTPFQPNTNFSTHHYLSGSPPSIFSATAHCFGSLPGLVSVHFQLQGSRRLKKSSTLGIVRKLCTSPSIYLWRIYGLLISIFFISISGTGTRLTRALKRLCVLLFFLLFREWKHVLFFYELDYKFTSPFRPTTILFDPALFGPPSVSFEPTATTYDRITNWVKHQFNNERPPYSLSLQDYNLYIISCILA